jgi:TP901-1 family phage major tail protein
MTAQKGALVLLKIGSGGMSESFATVGGLRATEMQIEAEALDCSNPASGAWRSVLAGAGMRAMRLSGQGLFTDSAAEETLRGTAFSGSIKNYQLHFGNGDVVSGAFSITHYQRGGEVGSEERFALTLESSGAVTCSLGG